MNKEIRERIVNLMYETGTSEWEMSQLTDQDLIKCFVVKFEEMMRKEKEEE